MTLLVVSIKNDKTILLKDFRVGAKVEGCKIVTDELDKCFDLKLSTDLDATFLTAGSLQVWSKIKDNLIRNKANINNIQSLHQEMSRYVIQDEIKNLARTEGEDGRSYLEKSGGFLILKVMNREFQVYKVIIDPALGASVDRLSSGTYFLGSGSKAFNNQEQNIHNKVWNYDYLLQESLLVLQNEIISTLKPLPITGHEENMFDTLGVSEVFSLGYIENNILKWINQEQEEGFAKSGEKFITQDISVEHKVEGGVTVKVADKQSEIKPFSEELDRTGNKIKRL